ncbi:hypothetical protein, partial [Mesorhizobium sp.]|uniref:hypothetical protein n=1 Tax=Mesorhizobium sp. TaxID=1871066 RepID=UPI0025C08DA2
PFEHHQHAIRRLEREAHGFRIGRVGLAGLGDLQRRKFHKHHALGIARLDHSGGCFVVLVRACYFSPIGFQSRAYSACAS